VQVVAEIGEFNWLEPYKMRTQDEAWGTGFFINDQGYVITAAHVIEEAKRVWIHIPSLGRSNIHVDIISMCPDADIALLKVTKEDLDSIKKSLGRIPFLMIGDSDQLQRADPILVLGYPLGQMHLKSATGIVSGREFLENSSYIQITAPINPGNSGGPLLNNQGHVVGIAISIVATAQNVGYAIPVNKLTVIIEDMLKTRLLRKPLFGIFCNPGSSFQAQFLKNPAPGGVYIFKVLPKSLAEQAALQEGDMLYEFNGHKIDVFGDTSVPWSTDKISLGDLIGRLKVGDTVVLVIYRNGKRHDITFKFQQTPPYPIRAMFPDYELVEYEVIGGIVMMQLADNHLTLLPSVDLVKYAKIENKTEPVLIITHILHGSKAQEMRSLFPGDVIKEVNGVRVKTLPELRAALQKSIETDALTVKTAQNVFVVLPFRKVLEDERRLAVDFAHSISQTVEDLLKIIEHGKEKKI
jgi:serine protease Do